MTQDQFATPLADDKHDAMIEEELSTINGGFKIFSIKRSDEMNNWLNSHDADVVTDIGNAFDKIKKLL